MSGSVTEIELFDAPVGAWHLRRAAPARDLAGVVAEYWEVEGTLRPFRETLLPNGAIEVMVNLGPAHELHSDQGRGVWTDAWISGLQERALIIESLNGTHLLSARLHALGAVRVLGEHVSRNVNRVVGLETLLGARVKTLREELLATGGAAQRFDVLERELRLMRDTVGQQVPEVLCEAVAVIDATHGAVRVSELHDRVGVSRRHLSVSFTRFVGLSPKRYAAIQRFTWALSRLRGHHRVDWPKLANDAGYSDQSHLARDFKRIGAATPTEYLQRVTPDGAALIGDSEPDGR